MQRQRLYFPIKNTLLFEKFFIVNFIFSNIINFDINYRISLQISGFEGIVQTSGFLVPGKSSGKLEVYNEETLEGTIQPSINHVDS